MSSRELIIESDAFEVRTAERTDGRLVNLERESSEFPSLVGSIFHARVRRVVPGMGSAFLDIGEERDAFMQLEDLGARRDEEIGDLVSAGERMLVQVIRDRHGKGARVSSRIGLPGRFLVLLPTADGVSVSRKVGDREVVQARLERLLDDEPLSACGWIVRTEGATAPESVLEDEARRLAATWEEITGAHRASRHSHRLHAEQGLAERTVRDAPAFERILVQGPVAERVVEVADRWQPDAQVEVDETRASLFARLGLDAEIERLQKPWVNLPSGGSLVIETTEALVSIDVNSGSDTGDADFEQTALTTNLEAAEEIAQQLRLRGLGGLIAIDFIDLRQAVDRDRLIDHLCEVVRDDPQQVRVGGVSRFGLVDLTRQRSSTSYFEQAQRACPTCGGRGKVASIRALRSEIRHRLARLAEDAHVELHLAPETAERLGDIGRLAPPDLHPPIVVIDPELAPSEVEWRGG